MTEGEIPCERHEAAASDPCSWPVALALLSALACPLSGPRLLLWLFPGPSPATVPSEGQAWSGAALEGACQPHGCVQLPWWLGGHSGWLREKLQEAPASKVSLKVFPKCSQLPCPSKLLTRRHSALVGRGSTMGQGLEG